MVAVAARTSWRLNQPRVKSIPVHRLDLGFHLTLKKGEHNYRPGMQHRQDVEEKPSK